MHFNTLSGLVALAVFVPSLMVGVSQLAKNASEPLPTIEITSGFTPPEQPPPPPSPTIIKGLSTAQRTEADRAFAEIAREIKVEVTKVVKWGDAIKARLTFRRPPNWAAIRDRLNSALIDVVDVIPMRFERETYRDVPIEELAGYWAPQYLSFFPEISGVSPARAYPWPIIEANRAAETWEWEWRASSVGASRFRVAMYARINVMGDDDPRLPIAASEVQVTVRESYFNRLSDFLNRRWPQLLLVSGLVVGLNGFLSIRDVRRRRRRLDTFDPVHATREPGYGLAVVPIHGTFSPNTDWSALRGAVLNRFGDAVHIEQFTWSGGNSHVDRDEASWQLAEHIVRLHRGRKFSDIVLVAHSHGGNIATRTLTARPDLQPIVRAIVCVCTPFVVVSPRGAWLHLLEFVSARFIGLALLATAMMCLWSGTAAGISAGLLLSATGMAFAVPKDFPANIRRLQSFIERGFAVDVGTVPLLVVRSSQDEALMWIRGFDRITAVVAALTPIAWGALVFGASLGYLSLNLYVFAGILAVVFPAEAVISLARGLYGFLENYGAPLMFLAFPMAAALVVVDVLLVIFMGAIRALPISWGEAIWIPFFTNVRARSEPSLPPGRYTVIEVAATRSRGLKHGSVHTDPAVARTIADWIAAPTHGQTVET